MSRTNACRRTIAGAAVTLLGVVSVACSSSVTGSDPTPSSQPNVMPTPNATQIANFPTPTPGTASAGPRVLWMVANHAGAGVLSVEIETDVETTAELRVTDGQAGGPTEVPVPRQDMRLARRHTISTGTGGSDVRVEVTVTDARGRKATGALETGAVVGRQYWGRGDSMPKLSFQGNLAAVATWVNLKGAEGPAVAGSVIVLSKKAGCTTAQACTGQVSGTFQGDSPAVSTDKVTESHTVRLTFPDASHDYQVVLAGQPGASGAAMEFYQFDVAASAVK